MHFSLMILYMSNSNTLRMFQTSANDATSSKALTAGTVETTISVHTVSIHITMGSAPGTLIDICRSTKTC